MDGSRRQSASTRTFPEFIRQAAQGSADLLIVPVNDWKEIKDIHFQMAAFRAIENGVPLVRAAAPDSPARSTRGAACWAWRTILPQAIER